MNNFKFVTLSSNWTSASDIHGCIIYHNDDEQPMEEFNHQSSTPVVLKSTQINEMECSDSEKPPEGNLSPCELTIASIINQRGCSSEIVAIDILCEAKVLEVYTPTDGYQDTINGVHLKDLDPQHNAYMLQHTFDNTCKKCTLKLLNSADNQSIWIHSIHITIATTEASGPSPSLLTAAMGATPDIDFQKVKQLMSDMNSGEATGPQNLLSAMQATQAGRKAQEASMEQMLGGLMAGMAGQMPPGQFMGTKAGMTAMFANMNTGTASSQCSTVTPGTTPHSSTVMPGATPQSSAAMPDDSMEAEKTATAQSGAMHTQGSSTRTAQHDDLSSFMNVFSASSQKDGRKQQAPTFKDLMAMATAAGINIAATDADDEMTADTSSTGSSHEKSYTEHSSNIDESNKENYDDVEHTSASSNASISNEHVTTNSSLMVEAGTSASGQPDVTHDDLSQMEGRLFNSIHEMEVRLSDWMKESEQRMHAKLDAVLAQLTDSDDSQL